MHVLSLAVVLGNLHQPCLCSYKRDFICQGSIYRRRPHQRVLAD